MPESERKEGTGSMFDAVSDTAIETEHILPGFDVAIAMDLVSRAAKLRRFWPWRVLRKENESLVRVLLRRAHWALAHLPHCASNRGESFRVPHSPSQEGNPACALRF
jgi:hypothetical protein